MSRIQLEDLVDGEAIKVLSIPRGIAIEAKEALEFLSFAEYMETCLYNPGFGYYSTGKVEIGPDRHFLTYPSLLSPLFGWMFAQLIKLIFDQMTLKKILPSNEDFIVLELGGGNGILAYDTLSFLEKNKDDSGWKPLVQRVRYVLGDYSDGLLRLQRKRLKRFIRMGMAEVLKIDARCLDWKKDFYGIVFANELMSAFPCERIRILGTDGSARRVHVIPLVLGKELESQLDKKHLKEISIAVPQAVKNGLDKSAVGLDREGFIDLVRHLSLTKYKTNNVLSFAELEVPLDLGWVDKGKTISPPKTLIDYLTLLQPLIHDLANCGLLPVELCWAPDIPEFIQRVSGMICGTSRSGIAVFIDYGGTSRHVLDPRSLGQHLRVYDKNAKLKDHSFVYQNLGDSDVTWDIDFTEVSRNMELSGLRTVFFGHQNALEMKKFDLLSDKCLEQLINKNRKRWTKVPDIPDRTKASLLVHKFREAGGFRMILTGPEEIDLPEEFVERGDPVKGEGLSTLSLDCLTELLRKEFIKEGLPGEMAECLKPCGDPITDLSDRMYYRYRSQVMSVLKRNDWLVPPGSLEL